MHVTVEKLFSLPKSIEIYLMVVSENLTIFYIRFDTKLFRQIVGIRWIRIAHCLWLIYSCSVMKETS